MKTRNAKFNENGTVDVEIDHPIHGWIPFTANADDVSEFGRLVHADVKGNAAKHVLKPKPPHIPRPIPDRDTAIRAIITALNTSGMDMTDAQAAMDKME